LLSFQPLLTGSMLALGTVPVLAGVVTEMDLGAMVTKAQVTPQRSRPALFDVDQRSPVTG
jgi:hypothetical protein